MTYLCRRMKTLKEITSSFKIDSAKERACLARNEAPNSFMELAQCMLAGHFLVTDGKEEVTVRPTVLEFYYHEEREDGIKDPIVYHKDSKSSKKPLILTGFLHNHVSGIDLTFEHENNGMVRASVLVREFIIESGKDKLEAMAPFNIKVNVNDGRSTAMYAALFSQFSVFDNGFNVKWEDGDTPACVEFVHPRKNVKVYDSSGKKTETDCPRKWKAVLKA